MTFQNEITDLKLNKIGHMCSIYEWVNNQLKMLVSNWLTTTTTTTTQQQQQQRRRRRRRRRR